MTWVLEFGSEIDGRDPMAATVGPQGTRIKWRRELVQDGAGSRRLSIDR